MTTKNEYCLVVLFLVKFFCTCGILIVELIFIVAQRENFLCQWQCGKFDHKRKTKKKIHRGQNDQELARRQSWSVRKEMTNKPCEN